MPDLTGKVALVTGASRGIGAAVAEKLAQCGASVAVNYSGSADAAHQVVDAITSQGGRAVALQANVRESSEASKLVEDTIAQLGGLDIVVNNAGITRDGLAMRMSDEDWSAVIDTNLSGVFYVSRAAARPLMKQRAGAIVNVASVIGLVGNAGQVNYAAAKAGVIGLTKSLAREFAPRGIRVNAVAPGFIETDMTATLPESVCDAARGQIALGDFGSTEDISNAIAFLASEEARYITGQTLAVDGGMTFA